MPTASLHPVIRTAIAVICGAGLATLGALSLGEYPITGAVPWLAAAIIPALIGVVMGALARRRRRELWVLTGPLAAGSLLWGIRIATSWGIDPVPAAAWAATGLAAVWPVAWGLLSGRDRGRNPAPDAP